MSISRNTFDPTKQYRRIRYHQRRDLLDSELNEQQDITMHGQRQFFDVLFAQGAIAEGLRPTVVNSDVTLTAGQVYIDGQLVPIPGTTLHYDPERTTGTEYVWVELLRLVVDATQDTSLVSPTTGEPTAEREQWVTSLQTRDTSADPLSQDALGRTVVAIYAFDRGSGDLTPTAPAMLTAQDKPRLDGHIGVGGTQHPVATPIQAGFMSAADKGLLNDHPGAGGNAHALATPASAGFMSADDRQLLSNLNSAYTAGLITRPDLLDLTYYDVYWRLNDNRTTPAAFFDYGTEWSQDANYYTAGPDILPYELTLKGALRWQMPIPGSDGGCVAFVTRVTYLGDPGEIPIWVYFVDDTVRMFMSETFGNWNAWTKVQVGDTTASDPYISSDYHNYRYFRVPVEHGKTYYFMFLLNNTNDGTWGLYLSAFIQNGTSGLQFAPQWPLW
ncbi:MAG TPA: DUF4815 domain-containing protein [Armatimonadota bacterium]|nr:DUF4815 domain-containing protein [Armatimonadota bacterium]